MLVGTCPHCGYSEFEIEGNSLYRCLNTDCNELFDTPVKGEEEEYGFNGGDDSED